MGPYVVAVLSVIPMFDAIARAPRMATEAVFALVVRVVVAVGLTCVPPWLREKWDKFGWRNAVLLLISFVLVPLLFYGLYCWADVPIPQYSAECNFGGLVLDALYPGFLAFLFNYVGEDMYQRASAPRTRLAYAWFNNAWVWAFIGTVALEFFLLKSGLDPWTGLAISVVASIAMTVFVVLFQQQCWYRREHELPAANVRVAVILAYAQAAIREVLWWVVLAVKVIVHLLPIPFWLKPVVSIVLTIALFIFVNVVLTTPRRRE
jgi:hypothetical protein